MSGEKIELPNNLSLRDYFAAAALPAIIDANCAGTHTSWMRGSESDKTPAMARDAYSFADAMLAAREATHD